MQTCSARRRAFSIVLTVVACAATACGGSESAATDASAPTTATTEAEAAPTTATTESDGSATTSETGDASGVPVRPEVVTTPMSAGPLTVTPTQCSIEGHELVSDRGLPASLALAGDHLFIATEDGIVAFTVSTDAGCSLALDTSIGDGGTLHPDSFDSLSGNAAGRLVAGNVFGMTVFDIEPGFSFECDGPNGQVTLSDDGTSAVGVFPTSAAERWTLSDTTCTLDAELDFPELADVKWVDYVGEDLYVGGEGLDEVVYATRYADGGSGAERWRVGNPEVGGAGWFGWIHGMAPCGPFACVVDTNTKQLAVIDAAGSLAASFDTSELFGVSSWVTPIVQAADGSNFTLLGTTYDDEATAERTYFGEVIRLEVTG